MFQEWKLHLDSTGKNNVRGRKTMDKRRSHFCSRYVPLISSISSFVFRCNRASHQVLIDQFYRQYLDSSYLYRSFEYHPEIKIFIEFNSCLFIADSYMSIKFLHVIIQRL